MDACSVNVRLGWGLGHMLLSICMVHRYVLVVRCKSPSFLAAFHRGTPPLWSVPLAILKVERVQWGRLNDSTTKMATPITFSLEQVGPTVVPYKWIAPIVVSNCPKLSCFGNTTLHTNPGINMSVDTVYRDPFKFTSGKTHTMRTKTALLCFTVSSVEDQ